MARRKTGRRMGETVRRELIRDDISAAAARALRSCNGFDEECREACREGVKATEQQVKQLLHREKPEVGKIKIIRER